MDAVRQGGEDDGLGGHRRCSSAQASANARQYRSQGRTVPSGAPAGRPIWSTNVGSPLAPANFFSQEMLTENERKKIEISMVSVARPTALPVAVSYVSSRYSSIDAEMSPSTSTSPRSRKYPVSVASVLPPTISSLK